MVAAVALVSLASLLAACAAGSSEGGAAEPGGPVDSGLVSPGGPEAGPVDARGSDAGVTEDGATSDASTSDAGQGGATEAASSDGGSAASCTVSPDAGAGCYAIACTTPVRTLQQNRDRLVADLAARKCTDACTLWASLNMAERYVFLMDTTYFGDVASRLYPPSSGKLDTALDHAVALYSINGPMAGQGVDGSGRGGQEYNRVYLGFDALGECVLRDFAQANPGAAAGGNAWVTSDDVAGPHAPFTQREMIFWYRAFYDIQSEGPQFHHWHSDGDFTQSGIDQRMGVCGNTDRSLVEATIAFDSFHNSDPLGDYSGRGGAGWQIVGQHSSLDPAWDYAPTGCAPSPPVNTDPYGGGTFAGMGPSQDGSGGCTRPLLGDAGCGP
jgi:hypothetical protein